MNSLEGKEICGCGNPSKKYSGFTLDVGTNYVLDFWCADCGGAIEALEGITVKKIHDRILDRRPQTRLKK